MKNNLTEQLLSQSPLSQNPGPDYSDDLKDPGFPEEGIPGTGADVVPAPGFDPAKPQPPADPDLDDESGITAPVLV